jgi:hypothetical protein
MSRRPVRGLEHHAPTVPAPRPPGPATILGPDGRDWHRHPDGLYYDAAETEVFSQSALRDQIERAAERLLRAIATTEDPILRQIANARTKTELRAIWHRAEVRHRPAIHGRLAVLERDRWGR